MNNSQDSDLELTESNKALKALEEVSEAQPQGKRPLHIPVLKGAYVKKFL